MLFCRTDNGELRSSVSVQKIGVEEMLVEGMNERKAYMREEDIRAQVSLETS